MNKKNDPLDKFDQGNNQSEQNLAIFGWEEVSE